ncbi:MAG: hypothetical protein F6K30_26070 [Cyanothece sp. SIO2G6]|nr:hypothetical protein [Cyanothece sp. SIO2G6]
MTTRKSSPSKKNQGVKDAETLAVPGEDETLVMSQEEQGGKNAEKLAVPTQKDTLASEKSESHKQAIEQASAIPQGLIENPTQGTDSDLNIKDGVKASQNAVSEIQKGTPRVELKASFLESLTEKPASGRSSLVTGGIQAQWQSHWEVIKCFEETPFSHLRGCIWH